MSFPEFSRVQGTMSPISRQLNSAHAGIVTGMGVGDVTIGGKRGREDEEIDDDGIEPLKKKAANSLGTEAAEDILRFGSDGKPLAILVGVVTKTPQYSAYAKKKRSGNLQFYMATADKRKSGSTKNQLASNEIKFSVDYPEVFEEIKSKISSELSSTNFLLPGRDAADNQVMGELPVTISQSASKLDAVKKDHRTRATTNIIPTSSRIFTDASREKEDHQSGVQDEPDSLQLLYASFSESIVKIEQDYKTKIAGLEKSNQDLQSANEQANSEIALLKSSTKNYKALQTKYTNLEGESSEVKSENANLQQEITAVDCDKKNLQEINETLKNRNADLLGEVTNLRGEKVLLKGSNTASKKSCKDLEVEIKALKSEVTTLKFKLEPYSLEKLSEVPSRQDANLPDKSTAEKAVELQNKYDDAQSTIRTLQEAQELATRTAAAPRDSDVQQVADLKEKYAEAQTTIASLQVAQTTATVTINEEPTSETQIIGGQAYDLLGGENAGFLQLQEGETSKVGRVTVTKTVILHRKRDDIFYFEGASHDELVKIEGGKVQREVIQPISGKRFTKWTLIKRDEDIRDDGKEYVAFDVVEAYHP